jgi:hypothetical protein
MTLQTEKENSLSCSSYPESKKTNFETTLQTLKTMKKDLEEHLKREPQRFSGLTL